eukprot:12692911-Alexandrium_andersonii.AAC.1
MWRPVEAGPQHGRGDAQPREVSQRQPRGDRAQHGPQEGKGQRLHGKGEEDAGWSRRMPPMDSHAERPHPR